MFGWGVWRGSEAISEGVGAMGGGRSVGGMVVGWSLCAGSVGEGRHSCEWELWEERSVTPISRCDYECDFCVSRGDVFRTSGMTCSRKLGGA